MCIPHLWIRYWSIAISYCILFDFLRGRDHPGVCQRKLTVVTWSCSIFRSNAWENSNPWIGNSALKKVVKPINLQGRQVRLLETEIFFWVPILCPTMAVFICLHHSYFCWVMPSPVDQKSILKDHCVWLEHYNPYGSKYLLRKCLGNNLLSFGGLSTFSDSVWIHREYIYISSSPHIGGPKIGDLGDLQLGETQELLLEGVGNRIPMLLLNLMVDRHFPY